MMADKHNRLPGEEFDEYLYRLRLTITSLEAQLDALLQERERGGIETFMGFPIKDAVEILMLHKADMEREGHQWPRKTEA